MHWILVSSIRFWRLVVALAVGVMVFGIAQLRSAPVDVYPEFTVPSVQIQTEALGLTFQRDTNLYAARQMVQERLTQAHALPNVGSDKFPGASTRDVTRGIDAALRAMAPGLKGMTIDSDLYLPASYLETALGKVETSPPAVDMPDCCGQWFAGLVSCHLVPFQCSATGRAGLP